jgi:pyrimidine-nucleoside phosphorylase
MLAHWLIEKKRDGGTLSKEEIKFLIDGYTSGAIPDSQMSALSMAIFFKGMDLEETANLTEAMAGSGDMLYLPGVRKPKADKHSTGGIGDKVSLVLAPLLAGCGVAVPMISGRGLGITGGTLDKLEAIPGYRTNLSEKEIQAAISSCGCCITGQTPQLAPADRKLYALRDITATVPSMPLIVSSILCKKVAEGIDSLVLDIKVGKGAFMQTVPEAEQLGATMAAVAQRLGKKLSVFLTDMDQPLGRMAGNGLEVEESINCLRGVAEADLLELTLEFGIEALRLCRIEQDREAAKNLLIGKIRSGEALEIFSQMVKIQGGYPRITEDLDRLPRAKLRRALRATQSGWLSQVDAGKIGRACVLLGAGRSKPGEKVDPAAGVSRLLKVGEEVRTGDLLLEAHAGSEGKLNEAWPWLESAFSYTPERGTIPALIKQRRLWTEESGKNT